MGSRQKFIRHLSPYHWVVVVLCNDDGADIRRADAYAKSYHTFVCCFGSDKLSKIFLDKISHPPDSLVTVHEGRC